MFSRRIPWMTCKDLNQSSSTACGGFSGAWRDLCISHFIILELPHASSSALDEVHVHVTSFIFCEFFHEQNSFDHNLRSYFSGQTSLHLKVNLRALETLFSYRSLACCLCHHLLRSLRRNTKLATGENDEWNVDYCGLARNFHNQNAGLKHSGSGVEQRDWALITRNR